MKLSRVVIRLDSGIEFYTDYKGLKDAEEDFNDIESGIKTCRTNDWAFLPLEHTLVCISKIESIYIRSREFNDD